MPSPLDELKTRPEPDYQVPDPSFVASDPRLTIPSTQQNRSNRIKAEDLATRGIPSYTTASGDVAPITEESGAALTGFDARHNIAYDSKGQPKHITYGETGPPVLKDAFAELPARTDPETGYIEKKGRGLYQFVGQDPVIAANNLQKEKDKAIKSEASLIGRKLSLDEHDLIAGTKEHKALTNDLQAQVPTLLDPKFKGADQETVLKAIDEHFNAEYASPEANASRGFFGGGLSPEAQTLRQGIDERKAKAIDAAQQLYGLKDELNVLGDTVAQGKAERRARVETLLAHSRGEKGPLDEASTDAGQPAQLYPPEKDWSRMLGGQKLEADRTTVSKENATKAGTPDVTGHQNTDAAIAQAKAGNKNYGVGDDDTVQFKPGTFYAGLYAATKDGLIDPKWADEHRADFKKVDDAYNSLEEAAGSQQVLKALLHGAGVGGAFLAGAAPGAKAGALAGAAIPGLGETGVPEAIGAALGGLTTGTIAALAARKGLEKLSEYSDAVKSLTASAELHPVASAAGELIAFGASAPRALSKLYRLGTVAGDAVSDLGPAAVRSAQFKIVGKQLGLGAVTGAVFEGALRPAFDAARYAAADAIGIPHDKFQSPDAKSVLTMMALGVLTAGHSIEFKDYSAGDVASIMARAKIRQDAGINFQADAPAEVIKAAQARGMKFDSQQADQITKPLTPQEQAVWDALKTKAERMAKSGAFEDAAGVKFTGATQARTPVLGKEGKPIVSAGIEVIPKKDGPAQPGLPASPEPTKPKPGGPSESTNNTGQSLQKAGGEPASPSKGARQGQKGQGGGATSGKATADQPQTAGVLTINAAEKAFVEQGGHADRLDAQQKLAALKEKYPNTSDRIAAINERLASSGATTAPESAVEASKSSTQVNLPDEASKPIHSFVKTIAESDLYKGENGTDTFGGGGYGRETEPHVTALYGITHDDVKAIEQRVKEHGPVSLTLGKISKFSSPDKPYDVLKVDVESPDLHALNATLKKEPFETDFPTYKPHLTLAYVKKGAADKYVGDTRFEGQTVTIANLTFSDSKGVKTQIALASQEKRPKPSTGEQIKPGDKGLVSTGTSGSVRVPGKVQAPRGETGAAIAPARITTVEQARASVEQVKTESAAEAKALGVRYVEGKFGRSGFITEVDGSSIGIDHEAILKGAATVNRQGGDPQNWIRDSHAEELIHMRDIIASRGQDFDGLHRHFWGELSDEAQATVRDFYPDTKKAVNFAVEYVRMVVQYRKLGRITESNFRSTEKIEPFLAGPQSEALEAHLKRMADLTTESKASNEAATKGGVPLLEKPTKTQRRANALTERLTTLINQAATTKSEEVVIKTLLSSTSKTALDQAESRIAKLENQHAIRKPSTTGILQHPPEGVGEQAGGRVQPSEQGPHWPAEARPQGKAEQPIVRQPEAAPEIDDATGKALDDAFEGLFAGMPHRVVGPALVDQEGNIIEQGKLGETHKDLMERAMAGPNPERALEAFMADKQHVFVDESGKVLDRKTAAQLGIRAGQLPPGTTEAQSQMFRQAFGAAKPTDQLAIPPDKIGGFVKAAQELVRQEVDTPEKLAALLESRYQGKARPFSQALWDMLGTVKPSLRGTHDWPTIYATLEASKESKVPLGYEEYKGKGVATKIRLIERPKNAEQLSSVVAKMLREGPIDRRQLTELASESGLDAKRIDEAAEVGIVRAAREIAQGGSAEEMFDQMVDLYDRQPNLTAKTSTSKVNQAYSTPAPLAFAASHLADITGGTRIYEPTAGNGMLLIEADPAKTVVNELDTARATTLKLMGFNPYVEDATRFTPKGKIDRVIANPPFGRVITEDQITKEWPLTEGETTHEIDHAISMRALSAMSDDGRAVLILGGKNKLLHGDKRADAYLSGDGGKFWKALYDQYKVVDHFTVSGDLYTKHGAGWPVDVVVIAGRGHSPIQLPSAEGPRILNTWDELRAELGRTDADRIAAGEYNAERDQQKVGGIIGAIRGIAGSGLLSQPEGRPERTPSEHGGTGSSVTPSRPDQGTRPIVGGGTLPSEVSAPGGTGAVGPGATPILVEQRGQLTEDFRVRYKPASKLPSFNIFVPTNMEAPAREALAKLEAQVGPIDDYVRGKLGYRSDAPLDRYFSAEQMDALALGINAIENQTAFVLGDQGGVGKGRVAAGMMAYAINQGKLPIFITKDVKLYAAMIEDLHDIGKDDITPIFTNSDMVFKDYAERTWKTGNGATTRRLMQEIASTGKLPAEALFTTYSQIQTDLPKGYSASKIERMSLKGSHKPPPDGPKMEALKKLAPNAVIIADESHLAAGDSIRAWRLSPLLVQAHGVYYSSATFAKRPDSMGIYSRTSLSHATSSMGDLVDAMRAGGVPLQQVVSAILASDGLYLRRERDFGKAVFRTHINLDTKDRDTYLADNYTDGIRSILSISNKMKEAKDQLNRLLRREGKNMHVDNPPRIETTNFASKLHNLIGQYLFAIKSEATVRRAIEGVTNGFTNVKGETVPHKVIIAFQNTMQAPIMNLENSHRPLTFNGMLLSYLDTQRVLVSGRGKSAQKITISDTPDPNFERMSDDLLQKILIGPAVLDPETGETSATVNEPALAELFRRIMSGVFKETEAKIEALDLADMPLSPIDHIKRQLTLAGIKVGEITGRSVGIDEDGAIYKLDPSSHTKAAHLRTLTEFNNTDMNVLLMNASGSTGIGAHSSEKFKRTDPRAMLILQGHLDINEFMQTLWRIDRTGQIHQPYYENLQTAIPAELRPAAIRGKKMAALNANTTSNAESEISEGNKGVDIFNQYGDEVVYNYLKSDPYFTQTLDFVNIIDSEGNLLPLADVLGLYENDGQFAAAVTGRAAVLPTVSQEIFWEKVMADYVAMIDYLNELGENELVSDTVDLKAETLESKELTPAKTGTSGFDAPSQLEKIRADIGLKPLHAPEVIKMMNELGANAYELKTAWQAKTDAWKASELTRLSEKVLSWDDEKAAGYEARWREQEEEISAALGLIGSGLHIKTEKGMDGYGAITAVQFDDEHPLTPSKQIFTVHVNTTKKHLRVPASQLPTIAREAVGDFADIYEATAERSNQRYMITGNLLSAYLAIRDSAPTAKIVQYTTDKGDLRQGILMPAKFMPGALQKKRVVESASHMRELLEAGRSLTSAGAELSVVKAPSGGFVLRVPSSRIMGGAYWRDNQLAALMDGGEFIERAGAMVGKFDAARIPKIYQRLLDLQASLFFTEQESGEAFGAARPIRAAVAVKDSMTNAAKEVGMTVKESLRLLQHLVSPTTGVAMDAHDQVMRMLGERNKKAYQTDRVLDAARQAFDDMPRPEQIAFIDKMKLGEAQATPELQVVAEAMRAIDTESWNAAKAAYMALGFKDKEVPLAWLENHYRVLWKKIPGSNDAERSEWIGRSRRGLRGSMGQHKQHTLETMSDGLELGGIPYSYNPVEMFKLAQADLWKLTSTLKTWKWAKDNGFVEFVRGPFPKAPDGMVELDDSIARVYFPAESGEGLIHAGKYFVEEGFGRLLNNYLSRDYIRQVKIGRGLLWLKNATTSLELSLSAFHGVFETLEAVGSSIGHGLHKLVNRGIMKGNLSAAVSGLKDMTIGAVAAPVTGYSLGREIRKAAANPEAYFKTADGKKMLQGYPRAREMIDDLFTGGWKPNELEQDWKNASIRAFVDGVADIKAGVADNYIGAGLRAFPAANEFLMKPLFDYYIPNLKLAQFFKEYAEAIEQNERKLKGGILTRAALARQTWRFVEDRFGEMNFDSLFWNRNFKTAMQLMFRSVTWKLGSVEAFAGAFAGQGKEFRDAFRERRAPELHRNMAWVFGMILLTATLGYIMSKVLGQKEPKNLTDFVFPQIDPKDDKVRASLPTYFKDLVHLLHSPSNYVVASMSGWIGRVADLLRNKDYYGVQIRDSDDPVTKQALQVGKYAGVSLLPFSVRGYKNLSDQDVGMLRKLLSALGINPAPRYIGQSAAERRSEEYWKGTQSEAGLKPAQFENKREKRKLVAKLRHGESIDISGALASGTLKPGEIKPLYQRAQMGALASQVNHMPLVEAERVYSLASPKERTQLVGIMAKKRANSVKRGKRMFQGF